MGGSPKSNIKPRPSYEDGELRDSKVEERQEDFPKERLFRILRRATRTARDHTA